MKSGFYYDLDEKDYNDDVSWRRSALATIVQKSLNYYNKKEQKETPALTFGRAIHCALLEPNAFSKRFIEKKEFGRKKEDLENKKLWMESVSHMEILSTEDIEKIHLMKKRLLEHPVVEKLLSLSKKEVSAFTEIDGIKRKARFDMMIKEHGVIIDYKTSVDASYSSFRKSISNYLYDLQAADYLNIANHIEGKDVYNSFIFIVQEKESPFEIAIYRLDDASIEVGEEIRKHAMSKLKSALEDENKASYPIEIQDISLPAFGFDVQSRINI